MQSLQKLFIGNILMLYVLVLCQFLIYKCICHPPGLPREGVHQG